LQHSKNDIFADFAPASRSIAEDFHGPACGGALPQLVVDERQEVGSSPAVACRGRIEEAGYVGQDG
jgi:hypothetical protein